jgi:demethylmenaquinone methyltransferase/2-methoxy-6-polyprenyl-1,4-benzoquinol methylase
MSSAAAREKRAEKHDETYGLKEDWNRVEEILRESIPIYDKTNRYISFGSDLKVRRTGLRYLREEIESREKPVVIDLGSGPGKMTELLGLPTVLIDALMPMLRAAKRTNSSSDGVIGIFENLPLRDESSDAALSGFAIRDARNLADSLLEIRRVLKDGGPFLIVDLSKPDSKFKRALVATYWKAVAPLLAFAAVGRLGLKFAALSKTYQKLPSNSNFISLAQTLGFELAKSKYFMLDGVSILLLRKKS